MEYLGHVADKEGIQPMPEKVRAVTDAPAPTNVGELNLLLPGIGSVLFVSLLNV